MATLTDNIQAILSDTKLSRSQQDAALIKLGLRVADISHLRFSERLKNKARRTYTGFRIGSLTFGVEIECYDAPHTALIAAFVEQGLATLETGYYHHDQQERFTLAHDGSLCGNDTVECVTPILKGKKGENSLKKACKALNTVGARVNRTCGLHVHFGLNKITDAHYVRIFKNYAKIEHIIDSFMPESRRGNRNHYCQSIVQYNFAVCAAKDEIADMMNHDRYHKVNPMSYTKHKTIEFRQHSGTTDYKKIMMWVQFLRELIEWSYENEITEIPVLIDQLPFASDEVKAYYNRRAQELA